MTKTSALIGVSDSFRRMMTLVDQVASRSASVVIEGEPGCERESVAMAVHERSPRRSGPFVSVACTVVPEWRIESELFGNETGEPRDIELMDQPFVSVSSRAMDGAHSKQGVFELAQRGTLFLDEIDCLSPAAQEGLLNALQRGEFRRVGGRHALRSDARLIGATHLDLTEWARKGCFLADLYAQVSETTITIPPLRDRVEDIRPLAEYFVRLYDTDQRLKGIGAQALSWLEKYPWPGNVTELERVIERAVILARGSRVEWRDVREATGWLDLSEL